MRASTKGEILPRYIPWVRLWVYILYISWCEHYRDSPLRLLHLRSPLLIHAQACTHTHTCKHTLTHTHPAVQNLLARLPESSTTSLCCSGSASSATGQKSRLSQIGQPRTDPPTARCLPGKLNKSAWEETWGWVRAICARRGCCSSITDMMAYIKISSRRDVVEGCSTKEAEVDLLEGCCLVESGCVWYTHCLGI